MAEQAVRVYGMDCATVLNAILLELKERVRTSYFQTTLILQAINDDVMDDAEKLFRQAMLTFTLPDADDMGLWTTIDLVSSAKGLTTLFLTETVQFDFKILFKIRAVTDEEKIMATVRDFVKDYIHYLEFTRPQIRDCVSNMLQLFDLLRHHDKFSISSMLPLCIPHPGTVSGCKRVAELVFAELMLNNAFLSERKMLQNYC